ncbi:MAG: asparagine synthase-related protein, partial [Halioglobus sp.]
IETQWSLIAAMSILYCWGELFESIGSAAGMDAVHPFQSRSMLPVAYALPYNYKFDKGVAKPVLRGLAADKYSYDFAYRPKKMFTSPMGSWMNDSPEFHQAILSLGDSNALVNDYLDRKAIQAVVKGYRKNGFSGHHGWKKIHNLYLLVGLEVWLQRFIKMG